MTILEAINTLDSQKHNTYGRTDKIQWLARLDAMVKRLIIDTHEGSDDVVFTPYTDDTDLDTVLLVEEPFDEVYLRWMEAQIDYTNGEYSKYNNSITMFNTAYQAYANHYNRTHMPKGKRIKFF